MSMRVPEGLAGTHCPGVEVPDVNGMVLRAAYDPFPFQVGGTKARKKAVLTVDMACTQSHELLKLQGCRCTEVSMPQTPSTKWLWAPRKA